MIRIVYISVFLFGLTDFHAQEIIIQPPLFAPFECTEFYKLYTGTITNFSQQTYRTDLVIEVDYTSPAGQSRRLADGILTAQGGVEFPPGLTVVDNATYEHLYQQRKITFYDKDIESLLSRTKCLPPGNYDVCLTLYDHNDPSRQDFLTQTCYSRDKEVLSPLFLVSPFEGEEIVVDLPLFTWTAVLPFNSQAMYRIQIVEVLTNQSIFEAFRSNPIYLEQVGLKTNILQYPISARPLSPCSKYAWRVTYELEGRFTSMAFQKAPDFLQESELWMFTTPCDEEEKKEDEIGELLSPKYYYKPSLSSASQMYQHIGDTLWFVIDNPYDGLEDLNVLLQDKGGRKESIGCCIDPTEDAEDDLDQKSSPIIHGKNYLALDLSNTSLVQGDFYKIIFKDFKEDLFINFQYKKNE